MANFKINFEITRGDYDTNTPIYRVKVTTALIDEKETLPYDGLLLLIETQTRSDEQVDVFYGIIKPTDFKVIGKRKSNKGQNLYRVDTWNLVFYNEQTMNEAIALMKSQVNSIAEGIYAITADMDKRSFTHISPSF